MRRLGALGWIAVVACGGVDRGGLFEAGAAPERATEAEASAATPSPLQVPAAASPATTPPAALRSTAPSPPPRSPGAPSIEAVQAAPAVLWTQPEHRQAGVSKGTPIVLQFDTPMDRQSAERATALYADGQPTPIELAWDASSTRLSVEPQSGLRYASGGVEVTATAYELVIEAILDQTGRQLPPQRLGFSTLRQVHVQLRPMREVERTGSWSEDGSLAEVCDSPRSLCAGDGELPSSGGSPASENTVEPQQRAFLSFGVPAVPLDPLRLGSARLHVRVRAVAGDPFTGLGHLHVERAEFDEVGPDAFFADPDATFAVLSDVERELDDVDVSWSVQRDLERGRPNQYRLSFDQATDRDQRPDVVLLDPAEQLLELVYLLP